MGHSGSDTELWSAPLEKKPVRVNGIKTKFSSGAGGWGGVRSAKVMIFVLTLNTEKLRLALNALPPTSPERKCS